MSTADDLAAQATADGARTFLELTRLLDQVEVSRPEVSAPLRLTLLRARREHQISWLDEHRFRDTVRDLLDHA